MKDDGGTAFPEARKMSMQEMQIGRSYSPSELLVYQRGLTKHEWYVGMALKGMLAYARGSMAKKDVVKSALELADEVIAQLKERDK